MRMEDKTRMIACMSNVIRIALSIIETIICKAKSVAITVKNFLQVVSFQRGLPLPLYEFWSQHAEHGHLLKI